MFIFYVTQIQYFVNLFSLPSQTELVCNRIEISKKTNLVWSNIHVLLMYYSCSFDAIFMFFWCVIHVLLMYYSCSFDVLFMFFWCIIHVLFSIKIVCLFVLKRLPKLMEHIAEKTPIWRIAVRETSVSRYLGDPLKPISPSLYYRIEKFNSDPHCSIVLSGLRRIFRNSEFNQKYFFVYKSTDNE